MTTQNKIQNNSLEKGNNKKKSIMKTIKLNKIVLLIFGLVVFNACVQDDEFDVPNTTITEPVLDLEVITIDNLISAFEQEFASFIDDLGLDPNNSFDVATIAALKEDYVISLENTNNYVSGYVISNDEGGNWFEEIILQNKASEATAGVRVMIDVNPLFTRYQFGQLMYVKLPALHFGNSNGVLTLGVSEQLEKIASPAEEDFLKRSPQIETIVPTEIMFSDIDESYENVFVKLNDVQFNRGIALGENSQTFAGEANDEFDGERALESCTEPGSTIILSTSTFADFKSLSLPSGQGSLSGILTRNFFGDIFNIVINSPEDIDFGGEENRCDPGELLIGTPTDCDDNLTVGATTIFSDDFESYTSLEELVAAGWVLINTSGGSYTWGVDDFSNNTYAIANAFNTDQNDIETWLISPAMNLDNTAEDVLNFDVQSNFDGGEVLDVYVSTDFVDSSSDSNWSLLSDVDVPTGPSSGFGSFEAAGPIDTSCITGDSVRFGFRYFGSDNGITTRYHLDNVEVTGN